MSARHTEHIAIRRSLLQYIGTPKTSRFGHRSYNISGHRKHRDSDIAPTIYRDTENIAIRTSLLQYIGTPKTSRHRDSEIAPTIHLTPKTSRFGHRSYNTSGHRKHRDSDIAPTIYRDTENIAIRRSLLQYIGTPKTSRFGDRSYNTS